MQFKPNYPIYLQVADYLCEKVLTEQWRDGGKLPSVKELSVMTSVNPNTVIKSLSYLQENTIVNTQRGVGYFLEKDALKKTIALKKSQFAKVYLPEIFEAMDLLGITLNDLEDYYKNRKVKK